MERGRPLPLPRSTATLLSIKGGNANSTNGNSADRPLFLRGNTEFYVKTHVIKMAINIFQIVGFCEVMTCLTVSLAPQAHQLGGSVTCLEILRRDTRSQLYHREVVRT